MESDSPRKISRVRPGPKLSACNPCRAQKLKCDHEEPCRHCARRGTQCLYSNNRNNKASEVAESNAQLSPLVNDSTVREGSFGGVGESSSRAFGLFDSRSSTSATSQPEEGPSYAEMETRISHLERMLENAVLKSEALEVELGHADRIGHRVKPKPSDNSKKNQEKREKESPRLWFPERFIPDAVGTSDGKLSKQSLPVPLASKVEKNNESLAEPATATLERSPLLELLWPGWPSDLPDPSVVFSLSELFFAKSHLSSLIYKPAFLSGLTLPPGFPDRPHDCLIHAVLCSAAPLSPFFEPLHNRTSRLQGRGKRALPGFGDLNSRDSPNKQLTFAEFHLMQARTKAEVATLTADRNPLDWTQAGLLVCFAMWSSNRILEAFFFASYLSRACQPMPLTKLVSRKDPRFATTLPGLLGPCTSYSEENLRRIVFWNVYMIDVYCSGPPHLWEPCLADESITTCFPISVDDFQHGRDAPLNEQTLTSANLFEAGHTDDFILHLKSCILLKRVFTFISRHGIASDSTRKPKEYWVLDRSANYFLTTFPSMDITESVSPDRLIAYNNINLSLIHLHEHFAFPLGEMNKLAENLPTQRVMEAARSIIRTAHELLSTSYDFALCHPHNYICWAVAARVVAKERDQRLSVNIDANVQDLEEEFNAIIAALNRGAVKSYKAEQMVELVLRLKSGIYSETVLSYLLYIEGVLPGER